MSGLEQRVEQLEARIEALEDALTSPAPLAGQDQYDSAVLEQLRGADEPVRVSRLQAWYRQAGVKSKSKIKKRLQDLHAAGLIEEDGRLWRYSGPRQADLTEVTA